MRNYNYARPMSNTPLNIIQNKLIRISMYTKVITLSEKDYKKKDFDEEKKNIGSSRAYKFCTLPHYK